MSGGLETYQVALLRDLKFHGSRPFIKITVIKISIIAVLFCFVLASFLFPMVFYCFRCIVCMKLIFKANVMTGLEPFSCKRLLYAAPWCTIPGKKSPSYESTKHEISHNNPGFQCNIAITNFLF